MFETGGLKLIVLCYDRTGTPYFCSLSVGQTTVVLQAQKITRGWSATGVDTEEKRVNL